MGTTSELVELIAVIEEFGPIVEKAVPLVMSMAKDCKPIMDGLMAYQVEATHSTIVAYEKLGYTRKQAMQLTMWNKQVMVDSFKQGNKSK